MPVPASTCTVPPCRPAVPETASLSVCPAALTLTRKVEPDVKVALPATLSVVKGVAVPGATVPCATRPPMLPLPPSNAPFATVTVEPAIGPFTRSEPPATRVLPV